MNLIKNKKSRAVSETIGTLLLLSITVLGAVFVANFVKDGFFSANQSNSDLGTSSNAIQLTGYDTRDSDKLLDVTTLDNKFDPMLCTFGNTIECTITNADNIPSADGTEFIVLKIRNLNVDSILLQSIQVNNILHTWESSTSNNLFDASGTGIPGTTYPTSGSFSIVPTAEKPNPEVQKATNELRGDEEVRVIIKLSNDIKQDIKMWDSLLIHVNFGGSQAAQFIISSGDAKW